MNAPLNDSATMLIRQVHPVQTEDGIPMRVAFAPSSKDEGQLSTLHGRVGPREAYDRHVAADLETAGSWHFSVGEAQSADLPAVEDGDDIGTPDHVSVDFRAHAGKAAAKQASRKVHTAAIARGCQHPA